METFKFVLMAHQVTEITLHKWFRDENGEENCEHKTFFDKWDDELYEFCEGTVIMQFKAMKKNSIDVTCIVKNF